MQFVIEQNQSMDRQYKPRQSKRVYTVRRERRKHNWPLDKLNVAESIFIPVTNFAKSVQTSENPDAITHHSIGVVQNRRKAGELKDKLFIHRQVINRYGRVIGVRIFRVE